MKRYNNNNGSSSTAVNNSSQDNEALHLTLRNLEHAQAAVNTTTPYHILGGENDITQSVLVPNTHPRRPIQNSNSQVSVVETPQFSIVEDSNLVGSQAIVSNALQADVGGTIFNTNPEYFNSNAAPNSGIIALPRDPIRNEGDVNSFLRILADNLTSAEEDMPAQSLENIARSNTALNESERNQTAHLVESIRQGAFAVTNNYRGLSVLDAERIRQLALRRVPYVPVEIEHISPPHFFTNRLLNLFSEVIYLIFSLFPRETVSELMMALGDFNGILALRAPSLVSMFVILMTLRPLFLTFPQLNTFRFSMSTFIQSFVSGLERARDVIRNNIGRVINNFNDNVNRIDSAASNNITNNQQNARNNLNNNNRSNNVGRYWARIFRVGGMFISVSTFVGVTVYIFNNRNNILLIYRVSRHFYDEFLRSVRSMPAIPGPVIMPGGGDIIRNAPDISGPVLREIADSLGSFLRELLSNGRAEDIFEFFQLFSNY